MNKRTIKVAKKIYELKTAGKRMEQIAHELDYSLMHCYKLYRQYKDAQIDKEAPASDLGSERK